MGKKFQFLALIVGLCGLAVAGFGLWIPVKAQVAQVLLKRAWHETAVSGKGVKPWPWADTFPVARLEQKRLGVDMIVLYGTNGETLAFGPGLDPAGGAVGAAGHAVLFGHRDTSFSFLQNLKAGDVITIKSPAATRKYRVVSLTVRKADEIYFNMESEGLSLVTCYPFAGSLPHTDRRFVVTALPYSG